MREWELSSCLELDVACWENIYIYMGSISSLIQISLNIIDIFCLHVFLLIRSYCRIAFIVFDENRSSPDDSPKSDRKYLGYIQLWKIHQSIPAKYDKSNTAIWTHQQENMQTENVYYVQRNLCVCIYIYIYIYIYPSMLRDRLQTQDLFLRGRKSKCTYVVASNDTWLLCRIKFPKLFNLFLCLTIFLGNKWVFPDLPIPPGHRRHV